MIVNDKEIAVNRDTEQNLNETGTQHMIPNSEVNKDFDDIPGGIRLNQEGAELAAKIEASPSHRSATENQSPGQPTIYKSSL